MNIQNISALANQLETLGFEKTGPALSQRICFKPDRFTLRFIIEKDRDKLSFLLHFEKTKQDDRYILLFHDAILHKEIIIPQANIDGMNMRSLEKQIAGIDWKNVFYVDEDKPWNPTDQTCREQEEKIETIMDALLTLQSTEDGKAIASALKEKYWSEIPFSEFFGFVNPLKNKSEVTQRFYFAEGQAGITVEEAYRFLQNKWMEKQIQSSRKRTGSNSPENTNESSSSGHTLSKRKRQKSRLKNNS